MGDPTPASGPDTPSSTTAGGGGDAPGAEVLTAEAPSTGAPAQDTAPSSSPAGWGAPAGWATPGADGAAEAAGAAAAGAAQRRRAVTQFGIAIALVVVGLVTTFAASGSGGGIVWTGAFLVAAGLLVRAVLSYRASVRAGASSVARDRPLLAGAAVVVVACVVAGGLAVAKLGESDKDAHASTGVGSCWKEDSGDMLVPVDCSHDHAYVGTKVVDEDSQCDDEAVGTVASDDGRELCLDPA
ncbi:hypothetical protein [Luteimicrobium sp. DT211]|uniref:hypothetical protein n=1 Tax=Luteimicrobium sp. DT211 TaxID=3393412 RepID=UPI003CF66531